MAGKLILVNCALIYWAGRFIRIFLMPLLSWRWAYILLNLVTIRLPRLLFGSESKFVAIWRWLTIYRGVRLFAPCGSGDSGHADVRVGVLL